MRHQSALRGAAAVLAAAVAASVAALVAPVGAAQAQTPVTIWVAGDSTVANDSGNGITGWARMLPNYLTSDATVQNKALAGRSIQTWMYEGGVSSSIGGNGECVLTSTTPSTRYQAVLDGMKSGDWFLIDFGINDGDPSCPRHVGTARYQQLMETLVHDATSRGAHAVLLTPTSGMLCSGNTAVANRGFGDAVRAAGSSTSSPVIDLTTLSVALYNQLHLCPNDGDFTSGAMGAFFVDRTHFEAAGATQIAGLVAKALADQKIGLAAYLTPSSSSSSTTTSGTGQPLVHSSGLCLQPSGAAVSGAALVLGSCDSPALWQFSSTGDVRYSGQALCFDAYAKGTTPGTKVVLWTCNGGANQQFGRSSSAIRGAASGLCLAPSGSAVAGASVVLDTCSGSSVQAWGTVVTSSTTTTTTSPSTTTTSPSTTTTTTSPTKTTKTTKTKSTKTKSTKTKSTKTKKTSKKKTKTRTAGLTPLTVW